MPLHFATPFRFGPDGKAAVNEQDSSEDVAACVDTILRYRTGQRDTAPSFGIDDPVFEQAPVNGGAIIASIEEQEPRARAALYDVEDAFDRARDLAEGLNIVRIALGVPDGS